MVYSNQRQRVGSVPGITRTQIPPSEAEDELIERLRAMTIPEGTLQNNESFIFDDIDEEDARPSSSTAKATAKPTRELCDKPSIQAPDFEELETTASSVQRGIADLRTDLDALRKSHLDFSRSFKADIQKRLLEFRKKASRVDDFVKNRLDKNNNQVFANELPVRQKRFRLTSDQDGYQTKLLSTEEQLSELEIHMELIRLNVIHTKKIEHPSQIDDFRTDLTGIIKNVSDVRKKYHGLEDNLKRVMEAELEVIQVEERFLKEEPQKIESMTKRCRILASTVETLQKLCRVQIDGRNGSPASSKRSYSTNSHTLV